MGFNTNAPGGHNVKEQLAAAISFLRNGWNAQAFVLLSELKAEKEPAGCFALGLCHVRAGELPAAISCFEQALQLLKAVPASPRGTENSETYLRLFIDQIKDKVYLNPMDIEFCERFPKAAEQTVLLALIDSYQQNGMDEQARRLSAGLVGTAFEEYKKQLTMNNEQ